MTIAYLGFVFTGVVNTFMGPILPELAARWQLSDSRAGYFFATQFFGSILGVGMSSLLLPRRGFRFCIGLAYLLMAAGVSGMALPQWSYALVGAFVLGFGFGLVIPATNLLISVENPDRRASALSILNFCWGLGAVLAPAAIAICAHRNHASAFVLVLSMSLLLLTVALFLAPGAEPPLEEKQPRSRRHTPVPWRFAAMVGGMFYLYVAIESSIGGWIATLAKRTSFADAGHWALAPSLFWAGLLAGRGLAPLVLTRVRECRLAFYSLIIAVSGQCLIVASSEWKSIAAAGFVIGLGLAAVFPITIALLARFQDAEKRIAGPMFALAGIGGTTMPWVVGLVSTWTGSLQRGLIVPLLSTVLLLWLHPAVDHESNRRTL
jgi:fucose permease